MRAQDFLRFAPQYPYGPTLTAGEKSDLLKRAFRWEVNRYLPQVQFVSQKLGAKTVAELEKTATALYIILREPRNTDQAQRLTSLKPHIALPEARVALSEVERIISEIPHH